MPDIFEQLNNLISKQEGYVSVVDDTFVASEFDDLVIPKVEKHRSEGGKKIICVIDDDFSTLDLMKIYLQRSYEYVCFDNPKNAIFYLNSNIPDLIFIDCYLYTIPTKKILEIIHSFDDLTNVPMVYLCEKEELGTMKTKLPEGVLDCLSRPVARGPLQKILDRFFAEPEEEKEENAEDAKTSEDSKTSASAKNSNTSASAKDSNASASANDSNVSASASKSKGTDKADSAPDESVDDGEALVDRFAKEVASEEAAIFEILGDTRNHDEMKVLDFDENGILIEDEPKDKSASKSKDESDKESDDSEKVANDEINNIELDNEKLFSDTVMQSLEEE